MRPFLAFTAAVFVFHHLPTLSGPADDWVDLLTPFVVLGTAAAVLLALRPPLWIAAFGLAAVIGYADGHGIHLAANSISREQPADEARTVAYFWDERFGHIEWHVGLLGLLVAFTLAERLGDHAEHGSTSASALATVLLGFTLFTSTVEGQDWWLVPPVAVALGIWTLVHRGPVLRACAGAAVVAALLMAAWAAWHGGMPEFSDLGWI